MRDVFISGWYGYPELFGGFAGEFEFCTPFVTHSLSDIDALVSRGGRNLFAWSTGAYLMLERAERPAFDNVVLVSPFLKFTSHTPERVLGLMIKKFADFPEKVAADFIRKCGAETVPAYDKRQLDTLLYGLKFLMCADIEKIKWNMDGVTLIHGTEDKIVSVESAREIALNTDAVLYEIDGAGHWINPDELRKYKI